MSLFSKLAKIFPFLQRKSLSEDHPYAAFCAKAAADAETFAHFRRNPVYNEILEHTTEAQGNEYLRLFSRDAEVTAAIDRFRPNDHVGDPETFEFPQVGRMSPSTLRYIKVLADLKAHFGSLDGLDVAEIGVGYGGQCRVIHGFFRPASYTLVDIQPALDLAGRYLGNFRIESPVNRTLMDDLPVRDYDLVISNYAFTELPRSIQDIYLEKVILKSKRGYITYNEITPPSYRSYKAQELVRMIAGARTVPEEPLSHPGNCIIVWGT